MTTTQQLGDGWYVKIHGPKECPQMIEVGKGDLPPHITLKPFAEAMEMESASEKERQIHATACIWGAVSLVGILKSLAKLGASLRNHDKDMIELSLHRIMECAVSVDMTIMANIHHSPHRPHDGVGGDDSNRNN